MKTEGLIKALNLAKPSLGAADSVLPILTHFVFQDDIVYAYNDVTCIIVGEQSGLECALHGDTLLGLLGACGAEVDVKVDKAGVAQLKTKSGWAKIPSLPLDGAAFAMPDDEPIVNFQLTAPLVAGIERCAISVSDNALKPEFAGVTIQVEKDFVAFYATDNKTASRFVADLVSRKTTVAVLPTQAVALLTKLFASVGPGDVTIAIGSKGTTISFPGAILFTKLLPAKPESFTKVFEAHADSADLQEVPQEALKDEITKASVVLAKEAQKECILSFDGTNVTIQASSALGKMVSTVAAPGLEGAVNVDPTLLARVLEGCDYWAVNDQRSLVLADEGGFVHIISSGRIPEASREPTPESPDDDIPF